MTRHDDDVRLKHMLQYAREAVELVAGKTRDDLKADRMLQLALTRLLEIVGEAATRVTPERQNQHPEIPWRIIAGMRNRLIHGYDAVDLDVLWNTVTDDLPPLIAQIEAVLRA